MAAKLTEDQKREILNAISEHLSIEGPRNWDQLAQRLGISKPTLFRYVKEVQVDAGSDEAPGLLRLAQKRIKQVVQDIENAEEEVEKCLPAIPSPNIIASRNGNAMVNIDFMRRLHKLLARAEMVQAHALTINPDGTEKIKNPMLLMQGVRLERDLMETALKAMQEVYDLNKVHDMHRLILDVLGTAAPELQREIIQRLQEFNNRYGITVEARL